MSSQAWRAEVRGGEPARLIGGIWVSAAVFSSLPGVLFTASHLGGCESAEIGIPKEEGMLLKEELDQLPSQ